MLRANLSMLARATSVLAGAVCLIIGVRRRSLPGTVLVVSGGALLARGASGYCPVHAVAERPGARDPWDTRRALGGNRGVRVDETITVNRDRASLYRFWRDLENLPRFMSHLVSVQQLDARCSHWVAQAPAGQEVQWNAEIIQDVADEMIAWRTVGPADVISAGAVHFKATGRDHETCLRVTLQYDPPAGHFGSVVAWLFGKEPAQTIHEDLRRFKSLLEAGEVATTSGQPRGKQSIFNYD